MFTRYLSAARSPRNHDRLIFLFLRSVSKFIFHLSLRPKGKGNISCCNRLPIVLFSQKRPRFSNHKNNSDDANRQEPCTDHYISNVNNDDLSTGNYHDGQSIGADSLLQNKLECHVPTGDEQTEEMDFECQSVDSNGCPPNLKGENISPAKGSPARELLQK